MVRGLIRTGLLVIVIAVAALIAADTQTGSSFRDLAKKALMVGAFLCGAGLVLGLLLRVLNLTDQRYSAGGYVDWDEGGNLVPMFVPAATRHWQTQVRVGF